MKNSKKIIRLKTIENDCFKFELMTLEDANRLLEYTVYQSARSIYPIKWWELIWHIRVLRFNRDPAINPKTKVVIKILLWVPLLDTILKNSDALKKILTSILQTLSTCFNYFYKDFS